MADEKKYISKIKVNGEATPRLIKDSEARALIEVAESDIGATNSRIDDIVLDYLKSADKTELQGNIDNVNNHLTTEINDREEADANLQTQINDIKADAAKVASGEKILGKNTNKELTTTLTIDYDSASRKVQLKGIDNALVSEFDASAFIKDGMLYGEQAFVADGTSKTVTIKGQSHTFEGLIKGHQYLVFCFTDGAVPTATYSWEIVDLQDLVDVYTAGNGISVENNVITAVAKSGDKYIEVTSAGIASKGIDDAIKVETDRAEAAEKAINDKIGKTTDDPALDTVYGDINGLAQRINTEETNRGIEDNALSNRIKVFEANGAHDVAALEGKVATIEGKEAGWDAKQDALSFDGTYNASTNKVATVSTVTTAIDNLDVTNISGFGADKTLATLSETNGKISATFQDISIPLAKVSDVTITAGELNLHESRITSVESQADDNTTAISNLQDNKLDTVKLGNNFITAQSDSTHGTYVDLGNIATTTGVLDSASYTDATHKLVIHKGDGTNVVNHTFGALADKSSVSGTASITHTPTDITLNGTFTPSGTVSVTLKNAGVLASVKSAGTLPTYSHTGFSGGSLGTESKSKFATKVINARIDSSDDECLEFFEEANTNTNFYSDAVTAQGTFTPAAYGTDTFTQGAMPTFNEGTVAVNSATFTGTADQAISTSGTYDKANTTATVTAE